MAVKSVVSYFGSVLDQGKKVVWPTRETVLRHTGVVVVVVAIASAFFASVDYIFQQMVLFGIAR